MGIYSSVVTTVNKAFTKNHGKHWFIENKFDEIFLKGKFGDGKIYINNHYRRNCMIKALWDFKELHGVKSITVEEAKKYVPTVIAEVEKFRNDIVKKYFGTWENFEKHYAEEMKKEEEAEYYFREINVGTIYPKN